MPKYRLRCYRCCTFVVCYCCHTCRNQFLVVNRMADIPCANRSNAVIPVVYTKHNSSHAQRSPQLLPSKFSRSKFHCRIASALPGYQVLFWRGVEGAGLNNISGLRSTAVPLYLDPCCQISPTLWSPPTVSIHGAAELE